MFICPICFKQYSPRRQTQKSCSMVCGNTLRSRQTAIQRGNKQRGRGTGKAYRKLNGRHEHRVIAEQKIGRNLLPGEVVHHKDGNKLNNLPDNLEVLQNQSVHARGHSTKNRVCSIEGCSNKHSGLGYCGKHYQRFILHGSTELPVKQKLSCKVLDCLREHYALGFCNKHWQQHKKGKIK